MGRVCLEVATPAGRSVPPAGRRGVRLSVAIAAAIVFAPALGPACILNVGVNGGSPTFAYLFPNWQKTEVVDFDLVFCDCTACAGFCAGDIRSLTVFNYGTATGGASGDITNLYMCFGCLRSSGGACTPNYTLTYAGVWTIGATDYPAWTWTGPVALNGDPCNAGPAGCACTYVWRLFADIASCPTNLRTVKLGPAFNDVLWTGGILDQYWCTAPWDSVADPAMKTIVYAVKVGDQEVVAPADTITYTIYYGKPGTNNLTNIVILDSQPQYTTYVPGSAVPAPDLGWAPDVGPPLRLRWTVPGGNPAGGATGEVRFKLTADWGNMNWFEPGSGDIAAPEGVRLENSASVTFINGNCPAYPSVNTPPTETSVRRFLFWKIGDNDVLYANTYGQPPDEMIYEIFIKNMSGTKTWWNVKVWDTVPAELDPWAVQCGFYDPCVGWTMTPTGCAAASPGRYVSGGRTILTWGLDMPPGMTLTLRWKAQVAQAALAGNRAVNVASIIAGGRTAVVEGTGHSGVPRNFTHLAPVILPTTYISYVGNAASGTSNCKGCGFFIDFFPLNKRTQFELRGLQYINDAWANFGGKSASIGTLIGDCTGGFPGGGGIPGGGIAGCKAERRPAKYDPPFWLDNCPAMPYNFIYKLVSNSPVLWQLLTQNCDDNNDNHTYAPATTLTYTGFMHYMWRRQSVTQATGYGDTLSLINTSVNSSGSFDASRGTTVHLFMYEYASDTWIYRKTHEIAGESQAYSMTTLAADDGPWRSISSDAQLIINVATNTSDQLGCCCGQCSDNSGAMMPTRQTGNVVSDVGSGTFYGVVAGRSTGEQKVVIGNTGAAKADYKVYRYVPKNTIAPPPMPPMLAGNAGSWIMVGQGSVGPGLFDATNPQFYGATFNTASIALFKVDLLAGGPIQVFHGIHLWSRYSGGAVLHSADGQQTGDEFWLHQGGRGGDCGKGPGEYSTQVVNVFCPKTGMAIQAVSERGYTARYTTDGPDQCIAFTGITSIFSNESCNYQFTVAPGGSQGNVITQYIQCNATEKGYTAPFLQTGTHYVIIVPPVVYVGQSYWLTVVVLEQGGTTKTDYNGVTAFSSTDPTATMGGAGMGTAGAQYTWSGAENGVKVFVNVVMNRLGMQTIVARDTTDGSITGVTAILVVGADIKLLKHDPLAIAASGDTVQFRICWSNYSSATGNNFVITDAVPVGTEYVPEALSDSPCGGGPFNLVPANQAAYSTNTAGPMPAGSQFVTSGGPAPLGTRWLRWTIQEVGVRKTGCVCFKVRVN